MEPAECPHSDTLTPGTCALCISANSRLTRPAARTEPLRPPPDSIEDQQDRDDAAGLDYATNPLHIVVLMAILIGAIYAVLLRLT